MMYIVAAAFVKNAAFSDMLSLNCFCQYRDQNLEAMVVLGELEDEKWQQIPSFKAGSVDFKIFQSTLRNCLYLMTFQE